MYSLHLFFAGLLLSSALFAGVTKTITGQRVRYQFAIDDLQKTEVEIEGKKFTKTTLVGVSPFEGVLPVMGRPEMPVIRIYVDGEGDVEVTPGARGRFRGPLKYPLLLTGPSTPKRAGVRRGIPELRSPDDEEKERFRKDFEVIDVGIRRGVKRRVVELYPVQWSPETGAETQIRSFTVDAPIAPPVAATKKTFGIVVPAIFESQEMIEKWLAFKRGQGYQTVTYFSATKSPETIRKVLQDWYKKWPGLESVVLVGDVELIPSFHSTPLKGYTDHYYASLDGQYASDLKTPDVQVGRLPIHNESELIEVLTRLIDFGDGTRPREAWLKKNTLLATNDPDFWKATEESLVALIEKYFGPQGFTGSFPEKNISGGDRLFAVTHKASGRELRSTLEEGRGFILYSGHGAPSGWENPEMKREDVAALELGGAQPFVFAFSCQTGRFTEASMAEAWVERKAGAISSVGSYADTYWDEDFRFQAAVMEVFLGAGHPVGDAIERGQEEVWRYYGGRGLSDYYWETYAVFSDPSSKYRAQ